MMFSRQSLRTSSGCTFWVDRSNPAKRTLSGKSESEVRNNVLLSGFDDSPSGLIGQTLPNGHQDSPSGLIGQPCQTNIIRIHLLG